jgi:anhydro-N-acetylmuramic acid kinase
LGHDGETNGEARRTAVGKVLRALGLMSGTSMDGIDVALIETDGEDEVKRGPSMTFPYGDAERQVLRAAVREARDMSKAPDRPHSLANAEAVVTGWHLKAITLFLKLQRLSPKQIDVIGFHGQTVLHRPESRLTMQVGDAKHIAKMTGVAVVYDLRAADIAAGGQGAPLAPVYHRALVARVSQQPIAVLNIGGVANVTWIGGGGRLIAFDTGPGGALLDDWMQEHYGAPYDEGGARAAKGRANADIVLEYLSHPYFAAPPPKSLDREAFSLDPLRVRRMSAEDGLATLSAFTAGAVGRAREHMPEEPKLWIVCGGGRKNKTLMALIAGSVENAVAPAEAAGLDGDSMEAEAWAYLAVRSLKKLPITFPGTTGAPEAMTGGAIALPGQSLIPRA